MGTFGKSSSWNPARQSNEEANKTSVGRFVIVISNGTAGPDAFWSCVV